MKKNISAVNAESANTVKSVGEKRRGQLLVIAAAVVGIIGFAVMTKIVVLNYVVGVTMIGIAFYLGSRKSAKKITERYSNKA